MTTQQMVPPGSSVETLNGSHLTTPVDDDRSFLLQQESIWLPPREVWLINPYVDKIDTPLNQHGLVDQKKLVAELRATVDASYTWPSLSFNPHHFQWAAEKYGRDALPLTGVVPASARDIPPLKGRLPRVLENWLHIVSLEPPVPEEEVLYYSLEAWQVAKGLFECGSDNSIWQRRDKRRKRMLNEKPTIRQRYDGTDKDGDGFLGMVQEGNQRAYDLYLERLNKIPPEFRLVQPETSPKRVGDKVGRLVRAGSRQFAREARRAA